MRYDEAADIHVNREFLAEMKIKIRWHGHATWEILLDQGSILVDPFFADNPSAKFTAADVNPKWILLTHGHGDHVADCAEIAKRTKAQVIANFEVANWMTGQGVADPIGMNLGGNFKTGFGSVKMVPAWHSSSMPDGSYGGTAAGFVIQIGDHRIWIAGDTALFSDMNLIGEMGIDVAIVPIGDLFTMGIEDSVEAVELANPRIVFPSHYNTWPPIQQDGAAWANEISERTEASPIVLEPGATHEIDFSEA